MSIFDDIKAKGSAYRLSEEALYAEALRELESGQLRDGVWAKAMSESDMDQSKASARYIQLRVISLKDEITVFIDEVRKSKNQYRLPEPKVSKSPNPVSQKSRNIFVVLVMILLVGAIAVAYKYKLDKDEEEMRPLILGKMIDIEVGIDRYHGCSMNEPYFVTLKNNSTIAIGRLFFEIHLTRRNYNAGTMENIQTNRILQPRESASLCLGNSLFQSSINIISMGEDPEISISNIRAFPLNNSR